ncbi:unnamed protein product [Penicillium glandicola]
MSIDSYACVQLECRNITNGQEAFMRIYAQAPHAGCEHADQVTRSREATEFTPPELKAYKFLTENGSENTPLLLAYKQGSQDNTGPVPRGHITWIVWEKVPGKCLGDFKAASEYWDMDHHQRKLVRGAFLREFPKAKKMGYFPEGANPSNLVWDKNTRTLYAASYFQSRQS